MGPTRARASGTDRLTSLLARAVIEAEARPDGVDATKEGSKVINRDWVNYHACSLSYYIYVVPNLYISKDNITKLKLKIKKRTLYNGTTYSFAWGIALS